MGYIKKCEICKENYRGTSISKYCKPCRPEANRLKVLAWYRKNRDKNRAKLNKVNKTYSAVSPQKNEKIEEIFEILKEKLLTAQEASETSIPVERRDLEKLSQMIGDIQSDLTNIQMVFAHILEPKETKEDIKPIVIDTKAEYGD